MAAHQEPTYEELKRRLAEAEATTDKSAYLLLKELKEALQKSDDNFRFLIDTCPLGVGIMSIKDNIIYANRPLLDIYGYDDIEEFKKLPLKKRQTPESYTALQKQRKKADRGELVPPSLNIDIVRKDGEIRHCMTYSKETLWEGSKRLIVLYQDITDSRQAKEALQESEERFSAAFRSSPNMCIIVNLNNGQYVEVNDRFVQVTGYSREELIGRTRDDINMWVKKEDEEKMVRLLQEPGVVRSEEFDFRIKSGEVRTWLCSVDIINIGGEPCMLAVANDITERRRANQRQRDENYILTLLGQGAGLKEQMDAIVRLGEAHDPSIRGSVLLYDSSKGKLVLASAPSLPVDYTEAMKKGLSIGPDIGSCGTAAYRKERVIVPDIANCPFFSSYKEVAEKATRNNLLASWSQPIIASNGDLLGVITNYGNKVGEPTEDNLMVLEWSARIAAIAIEHKNSQEALRKSEEKFSRAFRSSPDRITITTLKEGKFIDVNDSYLRFTGYTREEVIGHTGKELNSWVDPEQRSRIVETIKKQGQVYNEEVKLRIKSGEIFTSLFSAEIIDIDGEPCMISVATDITERRQAEEKLRTNENFLQNIFNGIQDGICVLDIDLNIVRVNSWMENMYQDQMPLVGKKCYRAYQKRSTPCPWCPSIPAIETGKVHTATVPYPSSTKVTRWIETSSFPMRDDNGRVNGVIEHVRDITERKIMEEKLEKERQESRLIIDSSPIIIFYKDTEGKFMRVNRAFSDALNLPEEEFVGKTVFDLYSAKIAQSMTDDDREIFDSGQPKLDILEQYESASGMRWVITDKIPILNQEGVPTGLIGFAQDITERIQAEQSLANESIRRRILIEQSRDGIVVLDENGKVYESNQRFAEMLGYTIEEVRHLSVWEWEAELPREQVAEMIRTVDEAGDHFETKHVRKDGTVYDVEISTNGAFFAGQKLIFCVCRDITERKQAEKALLQEKNYIRSVVDTAQTIILILDKEGRILEFNPYMEQISGYRLDEVQGKDWFTTFLPERDRGKIGKLFTKAISGIQTRGKVNQIVTKHGLERDIEWYDKTLKDTSGNTIGLLSIGQDITERKQAEKELRDKAVLLDSIKAAVITTDPDITILTWNNAAEELYGWSAGEVIGKKMGQVIPTEYINGDHDAAVKHFTEKGHWQGEVIQKNKDNRDIYVFSSVTMIKDPSGQPASVLAINRDISERKQSEKELRDKAILLDSITDAVITTDPDFTILTWNSAAEELYGWSAAEVIGKKIGQVVPTEYINNKHDAVLKHFMEKSHWKGEVIQKNRDNRDIYVYSSVIMIKDASGQPASVLAINRDITERKHAEETLRESEQKYSKLVEQGSDGIVIIQEGLIDYANPMILGMTGYSLGEVLGKPFIDFIPSEDKKMVLNIFQQRITGKKAPEKYEFTIITSDGRKLNVETSTSLFEYHGKQADMAIIRDITERKRLEAEQQRSDKLESIGTLAGGIAHDFNNLLTGIMGNIGLAKKYLNTEEKAYARLEEAEKASVRARDLTQQLLTFARGGLPVKKLATISELIAETAAFILRGSNVRLNLSFPDDLWAVEVDEGQIGQVINNLIINADEAMPTGGVIKIIGSNIILKNRGDLPLPNGKYVQIEIKDEGIGISKEHLKRIFEPYFTTKGKGSGLGMTTVYSIIKNHDGYISVESKQNKGTTFHILLPAFGKAIPKKKEVAKKAQYRGGGKILVMDDENIVRDMLVQLLTDAGYQVESVADGAAAIRQYNEAKKAGKPFDAVILDLTVPGGMGGEEAVRSLLKIDPDAKVIVSSGYSNDPIMADYKKYGFSGIALKPYGVDEIEKTLYNLLRGKNKSII